MASGGKNPIKDKLEEGELDLSMMQYTDVPVKEIEQLGQKVVTVNLSHNLLTSLPANFPLLSNIVKLDLSKNQLVDLPDNFGQFRNLKSLDLYANKLTRLPVSFAQLKSLKWLDLKDNNLVPALQQAAGPCITPNDCAMCAKKVVALLQSMESQLQRERQRKMAEEQAAAAERARMEEMERERVRQEKRAAKERRREEQKQREEERRKEVEGQKQHEMQINNSVVNSSVNRGLGDENNGHANSYQVQTATPPRSCCYTLFMFLMGLSVVGVALAISMIWIYTEGKLDSASIQTALPVIQSDVEDYIMHIGVKTVRVCDEVAKTTKPYVDSGIKSGSKAWKEGGRSLKKAAKYMETNYGDTFNAAWGYVKQAAQLLWSKLLMVWDVLRPQLETAWEWAKPHFHQLGKLIIETCLSWWAWLGGVAPVYVDWLTDTATWTVKKVVETWESVTKAN